MDFLLQNSDDMSASYQQGKQPRKDSKIEDSMTNLAKSDAASVNDTSQDTSNIVAEEQELRATRNKEQEIESYRNLQTTPLSKTEATEDEIMYTPRLSKATSLPMTSTRPSLRRTDTEVFTNPFEEAALPLYARWRSKQRKRGRLNINQDRVDADFILTNIFLDDVNTMLDFIKGSSEPQFQDIASAFREDPDNRGRIVEFSDLGDRNWGVRILDPLKIEWNRSRSCYDTYTIDDLPIACQEHGCDQGCPRKVLIEENIANLRKSQLEQSNKTPQITMIKGSNEANVQLHGFSECFSMPLPPPPTPPHSNKREVASRFPGLHDKALSPPGSPRPVDRDLPGLGFISQQVGGKKDPIAQIRTSVAKIKDQLSKTHARKGSGREVVRSWLQEKLAMGSSCRRSHGRVVNAVDEQTRVHFDGKLFHHEKIPAGPNSIRSEEYYLKLASDRQPQRQKSNASDKRREDYFAARVPPNVCSDIESPCAPHDFKQPFTDVGGTPRPPPTQRIKIRPQYEKYPDAYWKLQATRVEAAAKKRARKLTPTRIPNKGAMSFVAKGQDTLISPSGETRYRRQVRRTDFATVRGDAVRACASLHDRPVLQNSLVKGELPALIQNIRSPLLPPESAGSPTTTLLNPPMTPSLLHVETDDDDAIPPRSTDEPHAVHVVSSIRYNQGSDGDVTMREASGGLSEDVNNIVAQSSEQDVGRAHQRRIKDTLRRYNA